MKWYRDLYLGETLLPEGDHIIKQIKRNKYVPEIYVIAFASNQENLLDIIPAHELRQQAYPSKEIRIIGLAQGKKEALELVKDIIDEAFQVTGSVNVKQYLKGRWRDEAWR